MEEFNLYRDIQARTGGEIFLGVVGPVRTGKSTFIRRFMEEMVLPNLAENEKDIATDEMPTSGKGKTITTVEPKFVPKNAARLTLSEGLEMNVRLVDCVGYIVEGAAGIDDADEKRMVKTPWSDQEMPFAEAARIGTEKVIRNHSTVGIVVTCDGSFGELPRENFAEPEEKAIRELQKAGKPFIVLVNSERPYGDEAKRVLSYLESEYQVSALAVNCEQLGRNDIHRILERILYEFPLVKLEFYIPKWVETLPADHAIKSSLLTGVRELLKSQQHLRDISGESVQFHNSYARKIKLDGLDLATGSAKVQIEIDDTYYYEMLSEMSGVPIEGEYQLISMIRDLSAMKKEYEDVAKAVMAVRGTGYGVITPRQEEIVLEEPTVIKQGSKFGVKIKAASPSIHLIRADIETEIAPIVGSEQQAEDLIAYIRENSQGEEGIWETNIFGKSIQQLVEDGIRTKLSRIGEESQVKLQDTMKKIVNESNGGLVCIII